MPEATTTATPLVAENPIFAISDRAAALRAAGVDVITLAAGEPQAPTGAPIVAAAEAAVRDPRTHHYGSPAGLVDLREQVAQRYRARTVDPSDVQVAVGTKHALHLALRAVTGSGDDVLVVRPSWPGHIASVASVGANPVDVPAGVDGLVDAAALDRARTPRTRALVLSNPSNPSGAVHPPDRLSEIAAWCTSHDIWLVSDEVYGGLVFDGDHARALEAVEDTSRLITVDGVSKVYAMTGWRIGWLIAPHSVAGSARSQIASTITHVPLVTQHAALAALRDFDTPRQSADNYRRGRDILVDRLAAVPGVVCPRPAGGMFAFPNVGGLLGERWPTSVQLASWPLEEAHVAVVPGTVFGAPDHLRISFAVNHDRLTEAADRLAAALAAR